MNKIKVQLEAGNPYKSGSAIYIEVNGQQRCQVAFDIEDYVRIRGNFSESAGEFAYFAAVIYACDRAIKRDLPGGDRWTRGFSVELPVANPDKWNAATDIVESMLEFLTGDIWRINFVTSPVALFGRDFKRTRKRFNKKKRINGSAVSLFSGGLDSLIGAIDWLENNPGLTLVLASTYDAQAENARSDQERLVKHFERKYNNRFQRFVARAGLCSNGEDTNFRSRSLIFIGNAILAASFLSTDTSIIIPENGAIAVNFPLTPARKGSLSTRTVNPYFLKLLSRLLLKLDFKNKIINPYQFMTKGEMMQQCKGSKFLRTIYSDSVSCGKRGFDRQHWSDKHARGCGACIPCIFRRAAILKVDFPEEQYGYDLGNRKTWRRDIISPNSDLQAVIDFIEADYTATEFWEILKANGHFNATFKNEYVSLMQRLRDEINVWCKSFELI